MIGPDHLGLQEGSPMQQIRTVVDMMALIISSSEGGGEQSMQQTQTM